MGDIHHYAWRARHRNQSVYINKRDSERFGNWEALQVSTGSVSLIDIITCVCSWS